MGNNFDQTHLDILDSAKENFLKNGYERSNLREICKGANVTTGAFYRHFEDKESVFNSLVSSVIVEFKNIYSETEKEYYKILDNKNVEKIWEMSEDSLIPFIEFIYNNYDEFRLLLIYSSGTKYENFLDNIVVMEVKKTIKYMDLFLSKGFNLKKPEKKELHMLIHAYFSAIFEIVMHDYSKQDAIKYSKTIVRFFKPGWKELFNIKC